MNAEMNTGNERVLWKSIRIAGENAAEYLQGQISQDVQKAQEGAWTFILQPDSKVLALGWLHYDDKGLILDVPEVASEVVVSRLRRFILRMDVSLSLEDCANPRVPFLRDAFELGFPLEIGDFELTPHSMGGTWVTNAVSFTKGCFTGQELVGRLDARQAPVPFQIARLRADSEQALRDYVQLGSQSKKQGILYFFQEQESFHAVAVMHRGVLADESLAESVGVSIEMSGV
jgi:folate-binding protein YgfZ